MPEPDYERFAKWVMNHYEYLDVEIDGGDFQDMAHECGLLMAVEVTEPCAEFCLCAEYDGIPGTCYRKAYES